MKVTQTIKYLRKENKEVHIVTYETKYSRVN